MEKEERTGREQEAEKRSFRPAAGGTPDAVIEALLFVSSEPVKLSRLAAAAAADNDRGE